MGLFSWWKFGNRAEEEAAKKALLQLDIDVAIAAHENWKARLQAYLEGKSAEDLRPEVICCDDRCDLGRWIYGAGGQQLGRFAAFNELKGTHKLFHVHASTVVSKTISGDREGAQKLLANEYTKTSESVVRRLRDLKMLSSS